MTIESAIKHCEEVAEKNENEANFGFGNACIDRSSCLECAKEHRQLARWLEELKQLKEQANGDCINRQAVLESLHSKFADGFDSDKCWNSTVVLYAINEAPPVTPQPKEEPQQKIGHWTHDGGYWKNRWICSECGYKLYDEQSRFCPDCGSYNGGAK